MLDATARGETTVTAGNRLLPIAVRDLSFAGRDRTLLDRVSFTLTRSEKTVVMGPNGAGKSLLVRLMHGLIAPAAGSITFAGSPLDAAIRARQALIFQRPTLLRRSALANIVFVLSNIAAAERTTRAAEILNSAGLAHVAETPARRLSGGEQQRLAIARALALEPDILFLDEPCAHLDPAATRAVESMITDAHTSGTKIILVTHDIGQAKRLADEILFLHNGRVTEHRPAVEFFAEPQSPEARAYLAGRIF